MKSIDANVREKGLFKTRMQTLAQLLIVATVSKSAS